MKNLSKILLAIFVFIGLETVVSKSNIGYAQTFDQSYFVDIDTGFAITRTASGKTPKQFEGYDYIKTEVETAKPMVMYTHYYRKQVASPVAAKTTSMQKNNTEVNITQKENINSNNTSIKMEEIVKDDFSSIVGVYKAKNGVTYKFNSDRTLEIDGKKYRLSKPFRTKSVKNNRDMITLTIRGEGESDKNEGNHFIEIFSDRIEHSFTVTPSIVIYEPGMDKIEDESSASTSIIKMDTETTHAEEKSESDTSKKSKPVSSIGKNDTTEDSEENGIIHLLIMSLVFFVVGGLIFIGIKK